MSKKNELQESILKLLDVDRFASDIAQLLGEVDQKILHILETLEDDGLVSDSSMMQHYPWYLTKHGRTYLYAENN